VRGSSGDVQLLNKRLKHTFDVSQDVMIPESYDMVARLLQNSGSRCICLDSLGMLTAVDLDDDFQIQSDKIDDVACDGLLAFELDAVEAPAAQLAPHQLLGIRHLASQSTRTLAHRRAPSPNPLPNGERASQPFPGPNSCPTHC